VNDMHESRYEVRIKWKIKINGNLLTQVQRENGKTAVKIVYVHACF